MKEKIPEEIEAPKTQKMKVSEPTILVINERKIDLQAQNSFEIYQLEHLSDRFLACTIAEEKEYFSFSYQVDGHQLLIELPENDWQKRLSALIQIQQLIEQEKMYHFPLIPENFYMDEQGIVRILKRDLQKEKVSHKLLLQLFQALAGTILQSKYTYDQIFSGGLELLQENERTSSLYDWTNLAEAKSNLLEKQRSFKDYQEKNTKVVSKTADLVIKIILVLSAVLAVVTSGLYLYQNYQIILPQEAALTAQRGFLEKDYVTVIAALEDLEVTQLVKAEKYILAVSYIRSQSVDTFSHDVKALILSKIVPNGNERVMDYWVYLGRLDAEHAAEIALVLSDNQLLLYAYLQEMDNVSKNRDLEGSEKASKLTDLESKIQSLADKLGIDYDEEKQHEEVEKNSADPTETPNEAGTPNTDEKE